VEASTLPTVLLVNDGTDAGFKVVPMGRTYRFEPERPFKVLDPDAAHKLVCSVFSLRTCPLPPPLHCTLLHIASNI
jgi:hypothetical protein